MCATLWHQLHRLQPKLRAQAAAAGSPESKAAVEAFPQPAKVCLQQAKGESVLSRQEATEDMRPPA